MRKRGVGMLAGLVCLAGSNLFAGFASTETFLPAVGRVPGQGGTQFYTTVWATNLTTAPQTMTFRFLKQGQANGSPASFVDTLQPGETKVYENVVESKLGLNNAIGAARVTSTGEIFVSERIFNQAPGADLGNTEGLFFAGVPKSFSISAGQSASIQGINQGGSENFRYNFALVETGGGSPTVNVQVFDGSGTMLGQKVYSLLPYEQLQPGVGDVVAGIKTTNARITATVTGGTGSVLLAGAQLANVSQDSSGFEMSFRDDLLGGGGTAGVTSLNGLTGALTLTPGSGISITPSGSSISIAYTGGGGAGGISSVTHDGSLSGAGTGASPLAVANGQVVRSVNGVHDAVTLAAGSNVTITPSGSTLTIASSGGGGGGLTLPFLGSIDLSYSPFQVINNGSSAGSGAIYGASMSATASAVTGMAAGTGVSGQGVVGVSGIGNAPHTTGVYGRTGGDAASGEGGWAGIWGDSHDSTAVQGTSFNDRGVLGITSNSLGPAVEGLDHAAIGVGVLGRTGAGSGRGLPGPGAGVWGDSSSGNGVSGTGTRGVDARGSSDYGLFAQSDSSLAIFCNGSGEYTGTWTKASDARYKNAVRPIAGALEETLRLRGVTFEWRTADFPGRHFPERRDIGFIAQEVESVYPQLVATDAEGYKSVDYAALTPILVEAIKAQQRMLDQQKANIDDLRRRLERLEGNSTDAGVSRAVRPAADRPGTGDHGEGVTTR